MGLPKRGETQVGQGGVRSEIENHHGPETVKKMITRAESYHRPVLLQESIDGLDIQPDGVYIDATFGGGGHSREILRRLGPHGHLDSFDQDEDAEKNILDDDRFTFVRSNFRYVKQWMHYFNVERINGLLADLGVSSHHLDDETRGFSFRFEDAPLDMRMNKRAVQTVADILNDYPEERLADVLYLYGELKSARRIATAIVRARQQKRILTTRDLLDIVEPLMARDREKKDLARLFQALRIEVNHEMDALREMLKGTTQLLADGGRLSVITYHSLEDRIVKNVMRAGNAEGHVEQDFYGRVQSPYHLINNKVIVPSAQEISDNPRSRSAKLRIAEKR
jgi:16S rRNA (cytosine1402-N4)-methyltransferase